MRVEWHGQSAFTLTGSEAKVFIDPRLGARRRGSKSQVVEHEFLDLVEAASR